MKFPFFLQCSYSFVGRADPGAPCGNLAGSAGWLRVVRWRSGCKPLPAGRACRVPRKWKRLCPSGGLTFLLVQESKQRTHLRGFPLKDSPWVAGGTVLFLPRSRGELIRPRYCALGPTQIAAKTVSVRQLKTEICSPSQGRLVEIKEPRTPVRHIRSERPRGKTVTFNAEQESPLSSLAGTDSAAICAGKYRVSAKSAGC